MNQRDKAFHILKEEISSPRLIKHSLAVEAGMITYAGIFNQDKDRWAAIGLLHDIDFEKYPDEHPAKAPSFLEERGYDADFIKAILGHSDQMKVSRDSLEAKALYAVDELCSFIVACALVRSPKGFEDMKVKSVKKKLKDKAFARAVSRDIVAKGAEELGVELSEHITNLIEGLSRQEEKLRNEGLSLIE
ncbi:MAG: HD domain-containing protein [Clostridia bacterium]|nr:HD domain-containing protein [Clostridia bacterium]